MTANLLSSEAFHSSFDLFEKSTLLLTFDCRFCQNKGPIYSSNRRMLEFDVAGDRNDFSGLQKSFLDDNYKSVQSSEAGLNVDSGATVDTNNKNRFSIMLQKCDICTVL